MRSPPTSADWPPAGPSSAPGSQAPACDRPFGAPSTSPLCRACRASCGSPPCLPAKVEGAGADTQTAAVPPPTPAASAVSPRRPAASADTGRPADPSPPDRKPAAASAPFPLSPSPPLLSGSWASEVFSRHLLECRHVRHRVRQWTLQLRVIQLQAPKPLRLRYLQPAILRTPLVERRVADAVLPTQLCHPSPRRVLLQYPDDLFRAESAPAHVFSPPGSDTNLQLRTFKGGRSQVTAYNTKRPHQGSRDERQNSQRRLRPRSAQNQKTKGEQNGKRRLDYSRPGAASIR